MNFDMEYIFSKFRVGDRIDKDKYEFLKNYDKNNNSIFDQEDIDKLKKDLEICNKSDDNEMVLTNKDLLNFYNKAMSAVSSTYKKVKETDSAEIMKTVCSWFGTLNNEEKINEMENVEAFNQLNDFQKQCAYAITKFTDMSASCLYNDEEETAYDKIIALIKTIEDEKQAEIFINKITDIAMDDNFINDWELVIQLLKLSEEDFENIRNSEVCNYYYDYQIIPLLAEADDKTISRIVELLSNGTNYNIETIKELVKLSPEQQKQAEEIISATGADNTECIAKVVPFIKFLPDNFFENIDDYDIADELGECISYSITDEDGIMHTMCYDREKGLYEIRYFDNENKTEIIRNLRTKTEEHVEYRDDGKTVDNNVKVKYDSLEFDAASGNFVYGNKVSTETISPSKVNNMYNITTIDADGNPILPQQYCIKNDNGELSVSKEFISPTGVKTSYYYEETMDNIQIINYKITDTDGKVLMDKKQTLQKISDNKIITSINDNVYIAEFNNNILTITDNQSRIKKEIKLDFLKEGSDVVMGLLKTVPANLLMIIDYLPIDEMSYDIDGDDNQIYNNAQFNAAKKSIKIGQWDEFEKSTMLGKNLVSYFAKTFIHEYGHYMDSNPDGDTKKYGSVSCSEDLNSVLQKEIEALLKTSTKQEQNNLTHMIDNHFYNRTVETNNQECFAEAINVLFGNPIETEVKSNLKSQIDIRESFLMKDMPVFIAEVYKKAEQMYLEIIESTNLAQNNK